MERTHNYISEQRNEFARRVVSDKDDVIKKAICGLIGSDWSSEDLIGRCELIVNTDKSEVFILDNVPLVKFMPAEFDVRKETIEHIHTCNIKYELLN
ncbi:hypothetical protein [uncultured Psychrosphaera sp.]|uniref:hypothetical protein n=1 Tax=uncultured Psychrosphaera sp. TaxID=1403522 RepID=UPI002635FF4D|nr:hypothetical protein [uncultured Psychrosphaera sp.]